MLNSKHAKVQSPTATFRRSLATRLSLALACGTIFIAASQAGLFGLNIMGPSGDDNSQKRATINSESTDMLQQLYDAKPEMKATIAKAAGYATFKKTDIKLFLVASGNGYGVLTNNKTGQQTYMDVASLGGGVGVGINDLRVIFVFDDPAVMQQFLSEGWQFGGDADANAQYNNTGVAASQSGQANVDFSDGAVSGTSSTSANAGSGKGSGQTAAAGNGMQIYQFTQSGIALQATVSGTKYWVDPDLNN